MKKYPKGRPKALYAYISQSSDKFAKSNGVLTFGSVSRYIEDLIQRDRLAVEGSKMATKKKAKKKVTKKKARSKK